MQTSRWMILDLHEDQLCWNQWLDRCRTEWEKAGINGQEGKWRLAFELPTTRMLFSGT